jgi:hypothetical protein
MKTLSTLLLAAAFAVPTFAEDAAKKAAPAPAPAAAKETPAAPSLPVTAAVVTAPFVLKDGAISQPSQTEVSGGGKAVFTFNVAKAGDYVIHAVANAPDEDSNSFFLNVDGQPEDPLMIWDLEVTKGFENRIVGWRGSGDSASPEFTPKVFKLTAGEHKLIVVGREPALLKSVSIRPVN